MVTLWINEKRLKKRRDNDVKNFHSRQQKFYSPFTPYPVSESNLASFAFS